MELGLALQLTNILRDVAVDAARDRLYLPLEDLARFGVSEEALLAAPRGARRRADGSTRSSPSRPIEPARTTTRARGPAPAGGPPLDALGRDHGRRLPRASWRRSLAAATRSARPWSRLSRPRKAWIALRTVPRVYWGL